VPAFLVYLSLSTYLNMYIKKNAKITDDYKKLIYSFVIVTVLLVLIIAYFSASSAKIYITPEMKKVQTDFVSEIVTDGGLTQGDYLQGLLFEEQVEMTAEAEATGKKILEGDSIGKVTIYNNRPESQALVKITRLLSDDDILLRLTNRVDIPANGQIEADVYADDPNSFDELQPTKFIIPGLWEGLRDKVFAESKTVLKTSGNSIKVVDEVDIVRAKEEVDRGMEEKALNSFRSQLPNENYTLVIVDRNNIEEEVTAEVGEEVDRVSVKQVAEFTIVAVNKEEVMKMAGERLLSKVPSTQELIKVDLNSFSYEVQNFNSLEGKANIKVFIEGFSVIKPDNEVIDKEKLSGLSPKGVELFLSNYRDEIKEVRVELKPFWVKKVPKLKDHIEIIIDAE